MKNKPFKILKLMLVTTILLMPAMSFADTEDTIENSYEDSAADQAPMPPISLGLSLGFSSNTMKQICNKESTKSGSSSSGVNVGNKTNVSVTGGNLIEGPAVYNVTVQKMCQQWQQGSASASASTTQPSGMGIPGL